jgi:RHS repeat-associated protein
VTTYRPEFSKSSASGWTSTLGWFLTASDLSIETYDGITGKPATQNALYRIMRKFVTLPDGSRHEVRKDDLRHSLSDSLMGMYYAVDGSRIMYDLTTNTTFLPDGSRFGPDGNGGVQYIDRNGNFMNYTSGTWTDTLGRSLGVPIPGTAPAAGDVVYTLPGGLTYVFRWRNLADVLTDPSQPLRYPGDAASANCTLGNAQPGTLFSTQDGNNKILKGQLFNPVVLWQIGLPNNTNYTFTYNVWAELNKIVYPTGGTETFSYGQWEPLGGQLDDGTYSQANHGVNSRVVSDGVTPPQVWNYFPNNFEPGVDPATDVRIVTAPNGTVTKTWYYISRGLQIKYGFDDARAGMVREERVYNSSGTMLRRTVNQWAMNGPQPGGYATATRNARLTKTVEIILDTGGNALAAATEMTYDADLNVTSTKQYNFVQISPSTAQTGDIGSIPNGTLVRTQETDYLTGDANYRARDLLSLPTATRVKDGSGNIVAQSSIAYDESAFPLLTYGSLIGWSDPGVSARGNATTSSSWLNTTGANLVSHVQYDQCGNMRKAWDARDPSLTNPAQIEYSAVYQRAYPTLNTSVDPDGGGPMTALVTSAEYDGATGMVTSTIDANGQQTTFSYNDPLLRLKQVIRANGAPSARKQTTYTYDDVGRTVTVTSDLNNFDDNILKSVTFYDALGRRVESRAYEGGTNYIASQTQYDTMGLANKSSNPFRPWMGESAVWTTIGFDALGRVLTVTTPDNAVVTTSYSGNTATVTDQAGKARKSIIDALGRLTEVYEDPAGLNYQTSYAYDALDNLTAVTQGAQTRTFVYDSLKRLRSLTNPESGTVSYNYDNNSNLTQKTDARGVVSTYAWDALNRNTSVDYSNTAINPDVSRFYDGAINGKGRFWYFYSGGDFSNGSNVEHTAIDAYDALGRATVQRQLFKVNGTWGTTYQTSREYNLAGAVTSQTYPSGHTVSYSYDSAARTSGFTGTLGDGVNRTYANNISYSSFGSLAREQFGTNTSLYHKKFYNIRGQLFDTRLSSVDDMWDWNRGRLILYYSSNHVWGQSGTDNNGNVRNAENWIPPENATLDQADTLTEDIYSYDALNRLSSVAEQRTSVATGWGTWTQQFRQQYTYDRYGNRTIDGAQTWGVGVNNKQFTVDTTTNRLGVPAGQSGVMSYDNAGNLTTDTYTGVGVRTYDAENRIITAADNTNQTSRYTYNADGQRVRRQIASSQEEWQIYGIDGELLAEYKASSPASAPEKEYGYRNGQLLVSATGRLNMALAANGGVATASTAHTCCGFSTTGAINGNYHGPWGSGEGWNDATPDQLPDWFQVDFTGNKSIDEIDVFSLHDNYTVENTPTETQTFSLYGLINFEVQYWNGSSWVTIPGGSVTGNNKVWRKFTFSPITTSKIRLWITGVPDSWSRLVELQAWGTGAGSSDVRWLIPDHLGTPRMVADLTGSLANLKRHDYLPFGEELFAGVGGRLVTQGYTGDGVRQQFTQKERDVETGLDYFIHRYHSSVQGRFVSPDVPFADQSEEDPQSWNLYTYVRNSPINLTDPFGLWHWVDPDKNGNRFIQWDPGDDWFTLSEFLYRETGRDYTPSSLEHVYSSGGLGPDTIVDFSGAPSHYFTNNRGGVQDTSWDFYLTVLPAAQSAKAAGGILRGAWRGIVGLFARKVVTTAVKEEGLVALRAAYEVEVKALAEKAVEMKAAGHSVEEIATTLHADRRALGVKYKDMTPPEMLKKILERNLKKYGDELGPTIEWLRAQGKSWEEIIESASRPGGQDLKP